MTDLVPLDDDALLKVRRLAREGCREPVIRQVLGVTPTRWKQLRDAEDSPLREALDIGNGEGAGEIIEFMRGEVKKGSMRAAEWLGDRIYKIRPPKQEDADEAPRVVINLGTGPAPDIETFRATRVIDHDD